MSSTDRIESVAALDQIAESLITSLLRPRKQHLKGKAPRSKYVHRIRRDVKSGGKKPVHMILSSLFADIDEHIPLPLVLGFVDDLRAAVIERAAPAGATGSMRELGDLLIAEARAEGIRNVVEVQLHRDPDNLILQRKFLEVSRQYEVANTALMAEVARREAAMIVRYPRLQRPRTTGSESVVFCEAH